MFVSELCMGAMTFGGTGVFEIIGALGQDAANALVHKALDAGINFSTLLMSTPAPGAAPVPLPRRSVAAAKPVAARAMPR